MSARSTRCSVLPKPCWHDLLDNASACGESEPTVQAALARYKNERYWPGYKRFVVAPGGPVPAPVLAAPGKDRLCMRPWRGSFAEQQAVTFERCPQKTSERQHRWSSAKLYEWKMVPALAKPAQGACDNVDRSASEHRVRLVPTAAPHLCLSAPAFAVSGCSSGLLAPYERPEALRVDYATRMRKMEERRQRRERAKGKTQDAETRSRRSAEKLLRQQEKRAQQQADFTTRRKRQAVRRQRLRVEARSSAFGLQKRRGTNVKS